MFTEFDKIRLPAKSSQAIMTAFDQTFLPGDRLWIFGSRVDLSRKGGDIDLYVETTETDVSAALSRKASFDWEMIKAIGEQKIDIVLNILSLDGDDLSIYDVARQTGIRLI